MDIIYMDWKPENVITTDKYLHAFPNHYFKIDTFYSINPVTWRDKLISRPPTTIPFVVTGHGDYPVQEFHMQMYPRTKWFGTNIQASRAYGIPLGITNDTHETEHHPVYGNVQIMHSIAQEPKQRKNLVYMNFSVKTYPEEREHVWNLFSSKPWVTKGEHTPTMEGRTEFLRDMRNHDFVLCPRGAGIDTHRLWETLYMGSIPIVKWDIVHSNWIDLPILFINSWKNITEERLIQEYIRISTRSWNWKKLHVEYWINYIQSHSK
jgi:Exostosin family